MKHKNSERQKRERGSGLLSLLIYITLIIAMIGWASDYYLASNLKRGIIDSVKFAALGASQQYDKDQLDLGVLVMDETKADQIFLEMLQKNLSLDTNLNPLPGSPIVSLNKSTLYYHAYNSDEIPAVSPIDGHSITKPSYVVYVEVEVRKGLSQLADPSPNWTIKVAKDASLTTSP